MKLSKRCGITDFIALTQAISMIEAALAQAAVSFLVTKAAGGAAQTLGSEGYKTALEKLKGFLNYKFAGKYTPEEVNANPEALTSLVSQEASKDEEFRRELERLVKTLEENRKTQDEAIFYENVDSVTNVGADSISDSNVGNRDVVTGNKVGGSRNNIGGDYRGSTFR